MAEPEAKAGGVRGGDRRGGDRRSDDRRSPPPPWRRPWAFVGYGVAAALLLVMFMRSLDGDAEPGPPLDVSTTLAPPRVAGTAPPAASAPVVDGPTVGDFERLLAEGEAAEGQRVRTVLFCAPTRVISLRDADEVTRSIAELADSRRRVAGAECKWSAADGAPDFLLLVPPELAERFAAMPVVRQGFISRRRVAAEVEWLGRPEALALRTAGVLRRFVD